MQKLNPNDPETMSADIVSENLTQLRALFPEAFVEGKVDFDVLKQLLGGAVDEREEKYGLNWHGKRKARQLALTPSTGTLRPCPEDSIDWDTTQNLMIEGDNLEVLKLLQKSYAGKVKLIYIDPPYNTGNDFVYPDNFRDSINNYLELTGQVEGGRKMSSNTEASGRFHTDWLNMMYPRLKLAHALLRNDGALFLTIGDVECDNAKRLCTEIFGEENFQAHICWQKKYAVSQDDPGIASMHDHILVFSKTHAFKRKLLARTEKQTDRYKNPDNDPRGPWSADNYLGNNSKDERPTLWYPITHPITGEDVWPKESAVWRYSREKHLEIEAQGRLYWGPDNNYERPRIKRYLHEIQEGVVPSTWWPFEEVGHNDEAQKETAQLLAPKVFTTPKPLRLLKRCLELASDDESLVMDFFAGSGSFGHAVLSLNAIDNGKRRFILVQLPEPLDPSNKDQRIAAEFCDKIGRARNISELTKERLLRAGKTIIRENPLFAGDLGFRVFKLDTSNIASWDSEAANLEESLLTAVSNLKSDRGEADILAELLLKLGLDLCVPIEVRKISGKVVHSVGAGALVVCLATKIDRSEIEPLALGIAEWHQELDPAGESSMVFLDSAFADDVSKTNMTAILGQYGLLKVRSL